MLMTQWWLRIVPFNKAQMPLQYASSSSGELSSTLLGRGGGGAHSSESCFIYSPTRQHFIYIHINFVNCNFTYLSQTTKYRLVYMEYRKLFNFLSDLTECI